MLKGAVVTNEEFNTNPKRAIDMSFVSNGFVSDSTDNNGGKKQWRVKLAQSETIVSFFFQSRGGISKKYMGGAVIYSSDSPNLWKPINKQCSDIFFDTGFYHTTQTCSGEVIVVEMQNLNNIAASDSNFSMKVIEIRLYQTPNILILQKSKTRVLPGAEQEDVDWSNL